MEWKKDVVTSVGKWDQAFRLLEKGFDQQSKQADEMYDTLIVGIKNFRVPGLKEGIENEHWLAIL